MRDRPLAELTNLIDGGEPRDLYEACGKRIGDHFTARLDEIGLGVELHADSRRERERILWCVEQKLHERKAQKGFVVAWIYGSGQSGQSSALGRRTRKKNPIFVFKPGDDEVDAFGELVSTYDVAERWLPKGDVPKDTISWFIGLQRAAQEQTAPCIPQAMEFIKSLPMPLRWVSPSGVGVHNIERKVVTSVLSLYWKAQPEPSRNRSAIEYGDMDEGETRRAAPPNFIHSLDAAHVNAAHPKIGASCE
jgi:DNA-dependent RNA polymerase